MYPEHGKQVSHSYSRRVCVCVCVCVFITTPGLAAGVCVWPNLGARVSFQLSHVLLELHFGKNLSIR